MNIQSMRNEAYVASKTKFPVGVHAGKETEEATNLKKTVEVDLQKKEVTQVKDQPQKKELNTTPLEAFAKASSTSKSKIFSTSEIAPKELEIKELETKDQVSLYRKQKATQQYSSMMQIEKAKMETSQLGTSTDYKL